MDFLFVLYNNFEIQTIIKLLLGIILAGIIGLERSSWSKPAGFRTHALVGVSAVLVMICGEYMSKKYDITKHPNYKYLSDYNPKNAFSIEEFLSTRLKPKKDEQFINYEISDEDLARYSE